MNMNVKVNGIHEGSPMEVDINVEFAPNEYSSIVKEIPKLMKAIKALDKPTEPTKEDPIEMEKGYED